MPCALPTTMRVLCILGPYITCRMNFEYRKLEEIFATPTTSTLNLSISRNLRSESAIVWISSARECRLTFELPRGNVITGKYFTEDDDVVHGCIYDSSDNDPFPGGEFKPINYGK